MSAIICRFFRNLFTFGWCMMKWHLAANESQRFRHVRSGACGVEYELVTHGAPEEPIHGVPGASRADPTARGRRLRSRSVRDPCIRKTRSRNTFDPRSSRLRRDPTFKEAREVLLDDKRRRLPTGGHREAYVPVLRLDFHHQSSQHIGAGLLRLSGTPVPGHGLARDRQSNDAHPVVIVGPAASCNPSADLLDFESFIFELRLPRPAQ